MVTKQKPKTPHKKAENNFIAGLLVIGLQAEKLFVDLQRSVSQSW